MCGASVGSGLIMVSVGTTFWERSIVGTLFLIKVVQLVFLGVI